MRDAGKAGVVVKYKYSSLGHSCHSAGSVQPKLPPFKKCIIYLSGCTGSYLRHLESLVAACRI